MEIVENSDKRLVIRHRPWLLAGAMAAVGVALVWNVTGDDSLSLPVRLLVLLLGIGALTGSWYFFPFTLTVFDRPARNVTHAESRLTGTRYRAIPLNEIERAQVEAEWTDSARLTRLVLITRRGRFALERGFGNGDRRAVEEIINDWLSRPL